MLVFHHRGGPRREHLTGGCLPPVTVRRPGIGSAASKGPSQQPCCCIRPYIWCCRNHLSPRPSVPRLHSRIRRGASLQFCNDCFVILVCRRTHGRRWAAPLQHSRRRLGRRQQRQAATRRPPAQRQVGRQLVAGFCAAHAAAACAGCQGRRPLDLVTAACASTLGPPLEHRARSLGCRQTVFWVAALRCSSRCSRSQGVMLSQPAS